MYHSVNLREWRSHWSAEGTCYLCVQASTCLFFAEVFQGTHHLYLLTLAASSVCNLY